jgi:dTDP-4-amino-4,6-dideoxygalactose transaminase
VSQPHVPILDLSPEIGSLWDELNDAFQRVLRSGRFILGPEVQAFETEVADYLGSRHAVGVNSGTDALVIGLRALGIGPGDEVITSTFSFFATAESISAVGATPVFVDVSERSYNIDHAALDAAVTERTKAILPVHLYGLPADMDEIMNVARKHGLHVLEDCAQSFGARHSGRHTGTIGAIGAYSFFPSKNLGAFGDGGLIVTDDSDLAETARMLRAHGAKRKYENEVLGYNSRLDELQAALLRVKLPHVDGWNQARRRAATAYSEALRGLEGVELPEVTDGHVFHQYTIRSTGLRRDDMAERLRTAGVGTMVYYPVPQHRLPVYAEAGVPDLPVAQRLADQVLSLPMGPSLTDAQVRHVATSVWSIVGSSTDTRPTRPPNTHDLP